MIGGVFFAITIPISAKIAERGRRLTLIWVTVAIGAFGFVLAPLLSAGFTGAVAAMIIGFADGKTYGPIGTVLSELFPTRVRYTGSSLTFNLAGIFGASLAPYIATWLAQNYSLHYVGYYLTAASALTLGGPRFHPRDARPVRSTERQLTRFLQAFTNLRYRPLPASRKTGEAGARQGLRLLARARGLLR